MICILFSTSTGRLSISSFRETEGLVSHVGLHLFVTSMQMKHRRLWIGWMEEWLTGGKWQFNLPSMGQMQNGFSKGGSLRRFQESKEAREAEALVEDTAMITIEIENTGEVGAEVLIVMSVIGISGENGIIAVEVGATA